ncbi:hypothetical protein TrVFT333_007028 [Trichoderma virens FT-333]|nr:hypothetical protein TrVFT333_007028 [Trichoderma virens FT-333]
MSANSIERTTRLHALDLEYQQNRHKTDLIGRDEEARRLQLRVLLLRDENTRLQDKCAAKDAEIMALSRDGDQLRAELDGTKTEDRPKDTQIKDTTIGADDTVAETKSCEAHMQDLSRALDENIALTKELQQLRPEIELLRQQVANYEKMLSEQREKETASKKQSKAEKSNDESEDITELRAALDKITEKLAQEERQRETIKSKHRKELEESEDQNHKLEGRISTLEKKLKDSQKELRDVRKQLKASQSSSKGDEPEDENAARSQEETAKPRAKDQSPTQKERLTRKSKRATEQAIMGEKSTFSITPFLNKSKDATLNIANETNGLGLSLDDVLAQEGDDNASPLVMAKKSDAQPIIAPDAEQDTVTPLRPREKLASKRKAAAAAATEAEDEDHMTKLTASVRKIGRAKPEDTKDEEASEALDSKEAASAKRSATADPGSVRKTRPGKESSPWRHHQAEQEE